MPDPTPAPRDAAALDALIADTEARAEWLRTEPLGPSVYADVQILIADTPRILAALRASRAAEAMQRLQVSALQTVLDGIADQWQAGRLAEVGALLAEYRPAANAAPHTAEDQ